jgi:hypothetical protein
MYPNCDIVLKAIIRFKSFCKTPIVAAKNVVVAPTKAITNNAVELNSNIGLDRINMNIPAVTRVAACNRAETGVGEFNVSS